MSKRPWCLNFTHRSSTLENNSKYLLQCRAEENPNTYCTVACMNPYILTLTKVIVTSIKMLNFDFERNYIAQLLPHSLEKCPTNPNLLCTSLVYTVQHLGAQSEYLSLECQLLDAFSIYSITWCHWIYGTKRQTPHSWSDRGHCSGHYSPFTSSIQRS